MRKQSFVVGCDFCKKISEVEKPSDTPDGWYHVNISNKNGKVSYDVNAFDLCSIVCVQDWATARLDVLTQWEQVKVPEPTTEELEALWDEQDEKRRMKEASKLIKKTEKRTLPKNKCEYCDKMIAVQGLRLHMKHAHPELFNDWMRERGYNPDSLKGLDRKGGKW